MPQGAAPIALRRGAAEVAVSYLRRALAEDAGGAQRTAVLAELGRAEVLAGDPMATRDLGEALNATTDQAARATILGDLAHSVLAQGDQAGGRDLLEQAVEEFRRCDEEAAERFEIYLISQTLPSLDSHYRRLREVAHGGTPTAELAQETLAYLLSFREGRRDEVLPLVGPNFGKNLLFRHNERDFLAPYGSILALLGIDELDRAADLCDTVMGEVLLTASPKWPRSPYWISRHVPRCIWVSSPRPRLMSWPLSSSVSSTFPSSCQWPRRTSPKFSSSGGGRPRHPN